MKLTIVLTVYNKEPFLRRALDALLSQEGTKKDDYEVLAVNDGSSDGSAAILEEYAGRDKRLRVLTQENQGLSTARNNGADAAQGQYVWFVDADDTFSPTAVHLLCEAMADAPDVIPIYAETEGIERIRNHVPPTATSGRDVLLSRKWEQCGVFWVLRKDFLKKNDLRFLPGIYHEDAEFTPRMLYAAEKVRVVPEVLYTVIHEPNSITGVPRPKRAFDCLTVADNLDTFIEVYSLKGSDIGRVIYDSAAMMINNGLYVICQNGKEEQKRFDKFFYDKRKSLIGALSSALSRKYRIEAVLFKLFPRCYVKVYKLMKAF